VCYVEKIVIFAIVYMPVVTALSLDREERNGANRLRPCLLENLSTASREVFPCRSYSLVMSINSYRQLHESHQVNKLD
jgi:hypothetical protein